MFQKLTAAQVRSLHPQAEWMAALAATLVLILVVNPVGYVGGGLDDWRYLNAARCWAELGPCLPSNHWEGRWPLVGSLGAIIALLGESRVTVALPTLLYSSGCLVLLAMIGNRLFAPPVGYLAALLLLTVPTFAVELLAPSVGSAELFFLLASALALTAFAAQRRRWQAVAAGLAWGLACQVRETALIGALPLALLLWRHSRGDRVALLAAGAAAALPFLAEAIIFASQTGDPLFRRRLSLGHTLIASSELIGPVADRGAPFFNPAYIANWRLDPGIHLHWAIDGLVNLLFNIQSGTLLLVALVTSLFSAPRLGPRDRRAVGLLLALGLLWAAALIYGLAIDPKPRMMLALLTAAALALALVLCRLAKGGSRLLAVVAGGIPLLLGLGITALHPRTYPSERAIAGWAARNTGQIMVDLTTRTHLALVPAASGFAGLASERPLFVMRVNGECRAVRPTRSRTLYHPVASSSLDPFERTGFGYFCLLRRDEPDPPSKHRGN